MFARGSGQELGEEEKRKKRPQTFAFYDEIRRRSPGISTQLVEIVYDAVPVGTESKQAEANTVEAEWGWYGKLYGGKYNESVAQGEALTKSAIRGALDKCGDDPNFRLILGGYSQGAQVIGNVLDDLTQEQIDRIAYVGLFADPKFKGESYAARGAVQKDSGRFAEGVLDVRPEFPQDYRSKLESWCHKDDGLCQGSYLDAAINTENHTQSYQNYAIPLAARNATQKLQEAFDDLNFNTEWQVDTTRKGKLDIMFVLNLSSFNSLAEDRASLRDWSDNIVNQARYLSHDLQIGVLGVHDPYLYTYFPLDSDLSLFGSRLEYMNNYGSNRPFINSALQKATGADWRPDAKKVIISIAPLRLGPDKKTHIKLSDVVKQAKAQNVAIYALSPQRYSYDLPRYQKQITKTNGLPFINEAAGPSVTSMLRTFAADRRIYRGQRYTGAAGQEIKFNLTGFHGVHETKHVRYRWEFIDGTEFTTQIPVATHVYREPYDDYVGVVDVEIYNSDPAGGSSRPGTLKVPVKISSETPLPKTPKPIPDIVVEILKSTGFLEEILGYFSAINLAQSEPTQTIRLSWKLPEGGENYRYKVWAPDGALIGITAEGQTSVVIHDVPQSVNLEQIAISAVGAGGSSERTTTTAVHDKTNEPAEDDSLQYSSDTEKTSSQDNDYKAQDEHSYTSPANPTEEEQSQLKTSNDSNNPFTDFNPEKIAANPGLFWSQLGLAGRTILVILSLGSVVVAWFFVFKKP